MMMVNLTDSKTSFDISFVIPIYNESEVLPELNRQLLALVNSIDLRCEIVYVDDGSTDSTFQQLQKFHEQNKQVIKVIGFGRNFGHQLALTAGLHHAAGRAVVVMDADLQDPPEVVREFIQKWQEGYEVVYGQRTVREGETFLKKFTAQLFYKLIRATTSIAIPENVGDFYLLDRKVVDVINSLKERHRFIRGLIAWAGFKRFAVEYVRKPRQAGKTKYGLWKMIKFSFDAITSFSFAPLRFVFWLGAIFSIVAFLSILLIIYIRIFTNSTTTGWSSIMAVVLFIGGLQLLAIGIIGEYIARIGDDVKSRPLYTVSKILE